jgi:thiol-disulfide isomerase/thioredoxin
LKRILWIAAFALAVAGLSGHATAAAAANPDAASFDASADAGKQVEDALARSRASGKEVLLVMGANWCHDSRALAGWLAMPRFQQLVAEKYELVFVDVGSPQTGEGRNLEIARRYGIEVEKTPTVLILSSADELLNPRTAKRWNNSSRHSEDEIYAQLAEPAG